MTELKHRLDVNTLGELAAKTLSLNEVGFCNLATTAPIAFDPYKENHTTGAFILIDRATNATAAAGVDRVWAAPGDQYPPPGAERRQA